jgi:DNA-binding response OmpR family regulator
LETRLLDYLMLNVGHVVTTDAIINHVWGLEGGDRDMLRQLVRRLRIKLSEACASPSSSARLPEGAPEPTVYVETIPGVGYGLVVSPVLYP